MKQQTDLRMKQMQYIKSLVELYSDEKNLDALRAAAGEAQLIEMTKFRANLEKEKREREEKLKKEREEVEAKMREEHEAEIERRRKEFIAERERAEAELKKMEADAESRRQEAARTQAARIKEAHERQAQEADEAKNAAKKQQNKKLQERLAKKKQKLHGSGKFIEGEAKGAEEDTMELAVTVQDESRMTPRMTEATSLFNAVTEGSSSPALKGAVPAQLISSLTLIEKKLSQIESVVSALTTGSNGSVTMPVFEVADASDQQTQTFFHDRSEPPAGDALDVLSSENMDFQEESRIQFGKSLAALIGVRNLSIKIASSLPQTENKRTAFSQSYVYSHSTRTLFVHQSRVSSSGDFGLILVHALSHIKLFPEAQNRWNDQNPAFMSEFYTNLRILSQNLYKHSMSSGNTIGKSPVQQYPTPVLSRQPSRPHSLGAIGPSPSGLGLLRVSSTRASTIDEHNLSKTGSDTDTHRSEDLEGYFLSVSIEDRLKKYAKAGGLPSGFVDRYTEEKISKDL